MKKAQMVFENFLIGFLFLFILASGVFLFIGGGAGLDIDFFNQTIFSEPSAGLDFVYVTTYNDGVMDDLNTSAVTIDEETNTVSFSVKRTALPPKTEMPVQLRFYVGWEYCDERGCYYKTNQDLQSESFYTVNYAPTLSKHDYTYIIPDTKYYDCESQVIVGAESDDDLFNETVLENNLYPIPIPYCYYPPTDLSAESVCIPSSDSLSVECSNVRDWENEECVPVECITCTGYQGSSWAYLLNIPPNYSCDNPYIVNNNPPPTYTEPASFNSLTPASCYNCGFIGWNCGNSRNAIFCGFEETFACDCVESETCEECTGGVVSEPSTADYNPYLLRVDVTNRYHDLDFNVKVELTNTEGVFEELNFDFISVEEGKGLVQYLYETPIRIGENEEKTLLLDLSQAKKGFMQAQLTGCAEGNVRVSLVFEEQEFYNYVLNETNGEPLNELDSNGMEILTTVDDEFVIFQSPGADYKIYTYYGDALDQVVLQEHDNKGRAVLGSFVYLTHGVGARSYDDLPIFEFDSNGYLTGQGINCAPETITGDVCYCPVQTYIKTYDCSGELHYTPESNVESCIWKESYYERECLTGSVYEVVETNLQVCEEHEGCRCVLKEEEQSCTCSVETINEYFVCESKLIPRKLIEYYYTEEIIKDVIIENNILVDNVHWCVQ